MALKVKPLADRVVVEPAPAEEVSTGGIIPSRYSSGKTTTRYNRCNGTRKSQ